MSMTVDREIFSVWKGGVGMAASILISGAIIYVASTSSFFADLSAMASSTDAVLPFVASGTGLLIVLMPAVALGASSGALFGFPVGAVILGISGMMSMTFVFVLTRTLFKAPVQRFIERKQRLRVFQNALLGRGLYLVTLARFFPLHGTIQAALLGVTRVSFPVFIVSSLALVPEWILFAYTGAVAKEASTSGSTIGLVVFGIGLLCMIAATVLILQTLRTEINEHDDNK